MKKIYYAIAVLIIFLSACKKETSVKEEQSQNTPGKVITYHLKNGGEVTVSINNKGEYVVGGDVILSKDQIAYLEYNKVGSGKETTPRSTFTGEYQKLWPGGIIYYVINDASHSSDILNAMSDWEASTPIRFVQRTNQANYVNFQGAPPNGGGDSQLGMVGGQQLIRLSAGADKSTVIHEIGHAVGLMHEQTRTDRDQYINIDFSNINNDWKDQYKTYDVLGRSGFQIGTFDYNSVMLYPSSVPEARVGSNTSPQMTRKNGTTWGYNSYLSQGDIDGVNYLYKKLYMRLVFESVSNEQTDNTYAYESAVYLKFYTDETCTIPAILNSKLKISYGIIVRTYNRSNLIDRHQLLNYVTFEPGKDSYYIDSSTANLIIDYGLESGTYEDVLQPTIYHPNYFYTYW
ncbi:M12 family metallopeptidase [Pedobacter alluvionis]|uniref:Astacin (Peptidase family M12A) n=1 Tax=Pedobacter alluvionis TaxID=475253 RepID=A0A497YJY5_9SPHI|nr:M12 family metallopeptidase [Pedobacter alluvionis]RLJ80450.1 astacin (peptidase family M12A) [Pedobacter alluvionis]TFB31721.1 hypothetical protein E3V97_14150 [Pedobacter alluvionis]